MAAYRTRRGQAEPIFADENGENAGIVGAKAAASTKPITRAQAGRVALQSIENRNQTHRPSVKLADRRRSTTSEKRALVAKKPALKPSSRAHKDLEHKTELPSTIDEEDHAAPMDTDVHTDLTSHLGHLGLQMLQPAQKTEEPELSPEDIEHSHCMPVDHVLPADVEDIDFHDIGYPEFVPELAKSIYDYLFQRERLFFVEGDYLSRMQPDITPKMRGVLIDWLVEVHLKFKLLQETLFLTVNTIDRFLSVYEVKRDKLQLVGVTSMLIASKFEEIYAPEVHDFVYITDNAYTRQEILAMERLILNTLNFKMGAPLCLHFLRRMSKSAEAEPQTHTLAKYFMELTIPSYDMMTTYMPSQIAAAALCLSQKMLTCGDWTPTIAYYSRYTEEEITPCVLDLFELVKSMPNNRFQATRKKYMSQRFYKVAMLADQQVHNVRQD